MLLGMNAFYNSSIFYIDHTTWKNIRPYLDQNLTLIQVVMDDMSVIIGDVQISRECFWFGLCRDSW